MDDRELYRRVPEVKCAVFVDRVELKLEVGEVHVYLEHHEMMRWITGALSNLGHTIARGTVANILKRNVIEPAAGAQPKNDVEGVPNATLGLDRGC